MLGDAGEARDMEQDWYSARIVAMVLATNSKRGKYEPVKWMTHGHRKLVNGQRAAERPREPMSGEAVFARLKQLGVPIIDGRAHKTMAAM